MEGMYAEVTLFMSRQPQGPEWAAPALPPVARPLGGEPTPQAEHDPGPDEEQCVRPARDLPPRYWQQLDEIHLEQELRKPVRTVREPPRWFRGALLKSYGVALREWRRAPAAAAWKVVVLLPRMLLRPTDEKGEAGKEMFLERLKRFQQGEWPALLSEAAAAKSQAAARNELDAEALAQKRGEQAEEK